MSYILTRIVVRKLIWDEYNREHIQKHNVTIREVEETGKHFLAHLRTKKGRYLIISRVGSRMITVIINRKGTGMYYPVTARDSAKKETKEKKPKFPDFDKMTYAEEANWWDTHDLGDYWDEMEDVEIVFDLQKKRDETLSVRLPSELRNKLEEIAKKKGVNLSTLARIWLSKMAQSIR